MIALFSRWKLKDGCPPELAAAVRKLAAAVEESEPGTLVYSVNLPAPHPPIGPPPDYGVFGESTPLAPEKLNELVFFEVYRDAQAFSDHLRGPVVAFMRDVRHHFATPWQGHPRPEIMYLDPQSLLVRAALVRDEVRA
jgi:quinol monooxygenase YgiN